MSDLDPTGEPTGTYPAEEAERLYTNPFLPGETFAEPIQRDGWLRIEVPQDDEGRKALGQIFGELFPPPYYWAEGFIGPQPMRECWHCETTGLHIDGVCDPQDLAAADARQEAYLHPIEDEYDPDLVDDEADEDLAYDLGTCSACGMYSRYHGVGPDAKPCPFCHEGSVL